MCVCVFEREVVRLVIPCGFSVSLSASAATMTELWKLGLRSVVEGTWSCVQDWPSAWAARPGAVN